VDILAWNRINGLGIGEPAAGEQIDEIIGFYRRSGVERCFLQLSLTAQPESIPDMLEARGFTHYNNWCKLYRTTSEIPEPAPDMHIRKVESRAEAEIFGRMLVENFEWPDILGTWVTEVAGRDGWSLYLAEIGGEPVATAATFVRDGIGWLDMASTRPEYRGRGVQYALIARRIADCAEAGVNILHVEAAEEQPGKPAVSASNLRKAGFRLAYLRPNYIYNF
jgi:GNAT superfamily N-acetyltransferase